MKFYQATVVSHRNQGILIRGEPNSGKSTLALRLMARGAVLVADDCTYLEQTSQPASPRHRPNKPLCLPTNASPAGSPAHKLHNNSNPFIKQPRLIAHHIPRMAGKVAVRRVGILNFKNLPFAEVKLVVDLSPVFRTKEGKMSNTVTKLCGISLPVVRAVSNATTVLDVEAALPSGIGYAPSAACYAC